VELGAQTIVVQPGPALYLQLLPQPVVAAALAALILPEEMGVPVVVQSERVQSERASLVMDLPVEREKRGRQEEPNILVAAAAAHR
jgi:hypothetical protein